MRGSSCCYVLVLRACQADRLKHPTGQDRGRQGRQQFCRGPAKGNASHHLRRTLNGTPVTVVLLSDCLPLRLYISCGTVADPPSCLLYTSPSPRDRG
eukprot:3244295-Rhodomonas_salina.2